MPRSNLDLGRIGEDAALARYVGAGFRLLARNWRCRIGEIDLVLARNRTLVFCEVKTRRGGLLGSPFEAVHSAKQRKLRTLAGAFLSSLDTVADEVRFDVASVVVDGTGNVSVHLFEDAFQ